MKTDLINKNFNEMSFLNEIGNSTINELLSDPNTEITKKGNRLSMRHRSKNGVATLELSSYDTERRELRMSSVPNKSYKVDYTNDILEMKRQGMLQKDIAFELGISEAYVSLILKRYREK